MYHKYLITNKTIISRLDGSQLQVGKALPKKGVNAETHMFNPPSLSLAISLKTIGALTPFNKLIQVLLSRDALNLT